MVGCECQSVAEREAVVGALSRLERNFGIGNVTRAKEILDVLWDGDGNRHWLDVLEGLKWDVILA